MYSCNGTNKSKVQKNKIHIIEVTAANVAEAGIYCIRDRKSPGFKAKVEWFANKINKGLKIKIAMNDEGKQLGFIEYIPSELAWRPVKANNYYFIQCIALFVKEAKGKGVGSLLLQQCENDARANNKNGVCALSSDGPWIANKLLYEKNKFTASQRLGRFELMYKSFGKTKDLPAFIDWTKEQSKYQGWHLVYSDQCPWHEKSVTDIQESALEHGIKLNVKKLLTAKEAQKAPSGFGTYSLIRDGRLLADHYISRTRFENILKVELKR